MKTESMKLENLLSQEDIATIKGGQSNEEEETVDGGWLEEIIIAPPPTGPIG